jgi:TfoX/Sxy family transcriptional regulator of competence genes
MAYDEGLAQILRDDLADHPITEKKMFGGLCILSHGNMLCGVHKGGGMFRVGKPNMEAALAVPGADHMTFTGRPMGGIVECTPEALADDGTRARLLALALDFARTLPPK